MLFPIQLAAPDSSTSGSVCRSDMWFKDGTVVLQAESTVFRVYAGILSTNSPIFEDMFHVCQPGVTAEETFEGCPLVHMMGDSARDMYHFLKTIHDARYYNPSTMTDFDVTAGILRLSTKYNVDYLRQRAYRQLAAIYPTTLKDWDQRDDMITVKYFPGMPLAVANLVRLTDLPALLPAALCSCCWVGVDSKPPFNPIIGITSGVESNYGSRLELSWDDKRLCLAARESLITEQRLRLFAFLLEGKNMICKSRERCDSGRLKWLRSWEQKQKGGRLLHPFLLSIKWDAFGRDVCDGCLVDSKSSFALARQSLWDDLPNYFGLPSWTELRKSSE